MIIVFCIISKKLDLKEETYFILLQTQQASFFSWAGVRSRELSVVFNGTAHFKKCKRLFEYQHFLLLRDIWCQFYNTFSFVTDDKA
jgi:hypothetical protein